MSVKLLTGRQFEFLSLKGGCTGSLESTLDKLPHCWKSHVVAQLFACVRVCMHFMSLSQVGLLFAISDCVVFWSYVLYAVK